MRSLHEEVWRAPRAAILVGAALAIVIAGRAMAWEGHARPEPHCVINDHDPPTNVRTQPNGVIVGTLHNGDEIRIVDQTRAAASGRWPVGSLWDFVEIRGEGNGWQPYGWVYDQLVRCE
jgi:hypothetical protein